MNTRDSNTARFEREFRDCDPLSFGPDAPTDEYDQVAATAFRMLRRGATVFEVVSTVEALFRAEWGADLSDAGRARMNSLLSSWRGR